MPKKQLLKWPSLKSHATKKQTFNSTWLVVDAAFVDVSYVNYEYFESEVWTRFGIWIFVKISKLAFGPVIQAKDCQYFETEKYTDQSL